MMGSDPPNSKSKSDTCRRSIGDLLGVLERKEVAPCADTTTILTRCCTQFLEGGKRRKLMFEECVPLVRSHEDPIVDIGILFKDTKGEDLPSGYQLLEKTSGGRDADLNKGSGGKYVYLYFKRSASKKPITALSVICTDLGEEPPHGFEMITKTSGGRPANLNAGAAGRAMFLCVARGTGPPIKGLHILFTKVEDTPPGYCQVARTPRGRNADLNNGSDGRIIHLSYRLDISCILLQYQNHTDTTMATCLACLSAAVFCFDADVVAQAFESFKALEFIPQLSPDLLQKFVYSVCDSLAVYLSCFSGENHMKFLQFIQYIFENRLADLTTKSAMRMYETCLFLRHEDSRANILKSLASIVVKKLQADEPCLCHGPQFTSADWCYRCQSRGLLNGSCVARDICSQVTQETVDNVALVKMAEKHVGQYLRHACVGTDFINDMSDFVDSLFPTNQLQCVLVSGLVVLCKFSCQSLPEQLSGKSEIIKRRIHSLHLIFNILEDADCFFQSSPQIVLIMRRIFCTSVVDSCATVVPALFQIVLKFFGFLWSHFLPTLKSELGSILDICLLGMLQSAHCTPGQKVDLIEGLSLIFKTPQSIIDLFYNYDNDFHCPNLYENLVLTISKLTEGMYHPKNRYGLPEDNLKNAGLAILTNIMELLARWLAVPGLNGPRRDSLSSSSDGDSKQSYEGDSEDSRSRISRSHRVNGTTAEEKLADRSFFRPSVPRRSSRSNTWSLRFDRQKEFQKIEEDALKIAQTDKLKTAIKYLITLHNSPRMHYIAKWLYSNDPLDKREVGEFLGASSSKGLFSEEQHAALRSAYVNLLDFTSMHFDEALRHFLVDSNFRLPGESQKIDRLLQAFAVGYYKDNPDVFDSPNGPFVTSFALIMLNTDIHNPRLRIGAGARPTMTKEQFIKNMSEIDNGKDIPRPFLEQLFDAVSEREIKWKEETEDEYQNKEPGVVDHSNVQQSFREECTLLARKCQASLRTSSLYQRSFNSTSSKEIVKGVFEVSWGKFLPAISALLQNAKDPEVLGACLDGLKFGATISVKLGVLKELEAFSRVLAKFIFLENNKDKSEAEISKLLLAGEHLKPDWIQTLKVSASTAPIHMCKYISNLSNNMKARVVYDNNQDALRKIEMDFNDDICLVHPERAFLRAGLLTKVSKHNRLQEYQFFLFTDLLLYATENYSAFKFHRALHLSLCKLADIRDSNHHFRNAFRIVSPQKSITVFANSEQEKMDWLEAIKEAVKATVEHRTRWIEAGGTLREYDGVREPSETQLMSAFIGRPYPPRGSDLEGTSEEAKLLDKERDNNRPCKLCTRPFSVLRRRIMCPWCKDLVCKTCLNRTREIPTSRKPVKVCEACNGLLDMAQHGALSRRSSPS